MFNKFKRILFVLLLAGFMVSITVGVVVTANSAELTPPASEAVSAEAVSYAEALADLYAYLETNCGDPPNARSCDWGVYHEYSDAVHDSMISGASTSETMSLMVFFAVLYGRHSGDYTMFNETIDYIRNYMMPHDGQETPVLPDSQHNGAYQPVLAHWLIDVAGGTLMSDTGTIVGPNTLYLTYELHEGEDPFNLNPDPDREAYISPDDYKYASATDAEQWLIDALKFAEILTGSAEYGELAEAMQQSLRDGLTTEDDFLFGVIDPIRLPELRGWWSYQGGGASLISDTVSPGTNDDYGMVLTYTVPSAGFAGIGKTIGQDVSAYAGVSYQFLGEGGGDAWRVVLTDPASDVPTYTAEFFEHIFIDNATGWYTVEIPFNEFSERADWPPDAATTGNNQLDTDHIESFALEPLPAAFADDLEDGDSQGWWVYAVEGATLITDVVSPGANDTAYALQTIYNIVEGEAGLGVSPNADWSGFDGLTAYLSGANSGDIVRIELVEQGDERWMVQIPITFTGWQAFDLPFDTFIRRYWQPPGAVENDILDLDQIKDVIFSPLPGWFADDFEDGDVGDWWTYEGGGASIALSSADDGAAGSDRSLHIEYVIPSTGWAGAGQTVERDWQTLDGVQFWLRGSGNNVAFQLKDADDELFAYEIATVPADWTFYDLAWADFQYVSGSGNGTLDLEQIQAFIIEPTDGSSGTLYLDQITVKGDDLGAGQFTIDELALLGGTPRSGNGVAYFDDLHFYGEPKPTTYPNVTEFALQWTQDGKDPWVGPLYSGYQDPATFCLVNDSVIPQDTVTFLRAAQTAYDAVDPLESNLGPFMPIFVQDPEYSGSSELGWTWDGSRADENTHWAQFQYRTFAHLAKYYFISGDVEAKEMLDSFHGWLTERWEVSADMGTATAVPITMTVDSESFENGYRPGDFGLAAQGLIYMAARTESETERVAYSADARALLNGLVANQDELGAFPNGPYRFGFEQAEVGIAFALQQLLLGDDGMDGRIARLIQDECRHYRTYLPLISR